MKKRIGRIFLAISLLAILPLAAKAEGGDVVECFDYYKFQSVNLSVGPDKSVYMPGEKVRFSGELTNENSYPVVDGYVFIRVSRSNPNYREDWHDVVDEFIALEKVTLDAGAEKRINFEWAIPSLSSGDYRADYFFSVGKKYNLGGLPFSNEVTIGASEFQVVADSQEAISLVRSETQVNGQKYAHIGNWPKIEAGEKAEITQPLKNSFNTSKQVSVTYDLYWWDSLNEKDKITSKQEEITVPANGLVNLSYLVPEMKDSVYLLKITAKTGSQKSIVNIRMTSDQEHPRLNYPGLTNFPLQKGQSADLFSCFHNTASLETAGSLKVVLEDAKGNKIEQLDYSGSMTGAMMATKKTLTAQQEYPWLKLTATLSDKNGKVLETYEAVYDCALLNSDACKNALAAQAKKDDSSRKTKMLSIGLIVFLTILSLVIVAIKKKRQHLFMLFFCFLVYGLLANVNTSEAAVGYSCPEQSKRSISAAVMGFTGGSGAFASGDSIDAFPRSQFPDLYCDCSSTESACYKSCGYEQSNDGGSWFESYCDDGYCGYPTVDQYVGVDKAYGNEENESGVCDVTAAWKLDSKQLTVIHKMAISDATKPLGINENGAILLAPDSQSLEFVYVSDDPTYNANGDTWDTPNGTWCEDKINCGTWIKEAEHDDHDNVLYSRFSVKSPINFVRLSSSDNSVIGCSGSAGNLSCAVKGPGAVTITAEIPDTNSRMYGRITEDGNDKCTAYKGLTFDAAKLTWKIRVLPPDDLKEKVEIRIVDKDTDQSLDYDSPPKDAIHYWVGGVEYTTGATDGQSPIIEKDFVSPSGAEKFRVGLLDIPGYVHFITKFNCSNGTITEGHGVLEDGRGCVAILKYEKEPPPPPDQERVRILLIDEDESAKIPYNGSTQYTVGANQYPATFTGGDSGKIDKNFVAPGKSEKVTIVAPNDIPGYTYSSTRYNCERMANVHDQGTLFDNDRCLVIIRYTKETTETVKINITGANYTGTTEIIVGGTSHTSATFTSNSSTTIKNFVSTEQPVTVIPPPIAGKSPTLNYSGCGGAVEGPGKLADNGTCVVNIDYTVNSYDLTVHKQCDGTGRVRSTDGEINCGGNCDESYNSGDPVTLTAEEIGDSEFKGWKVVGEPSLCTNNAQPCQLTMSENKTVIARFCSTCVRDCSAEDTVCEGVAFDSGCPEPCVGKKTCEATPGNWKEVVPNSD